MQKTLRTYLHFVLSFALCIAGVPAFARDVEITLGHNMWLRTPADGNMNKLGLLAKGSIISINDDDIVVGSDGKVDLEASLDQWQNRTKKEKTTSKNKVPGFFRIENGTKQVYFPINIVMAASGSSAKLIGGPGKSPVGGFMALKFLQKHGNAQYVTLESQDVVTDPKAQPAASPASPGAAPAPVAGSAQSTSDQVRPPETLNPVPAPVVPAPIVPAPIPPPPSNARPSTVQPSITVTQEAQPADPNCPDGTCPPSVNPSSLGPIAEAAAAANHTVPADTDEITSADQKHTFQGFTLDEDGPDSCTDFITRDGKYGPMGKKLLADIAEDDDIYTSKENGMSKICPNYNKWKTDDERRFFDVWVFTSFFQTESTCHLDAYTPANATYRVKKSKNGEKHSYTKKISPSGSAGVCYAQLPERDDLRTGEPPECQPQPKGNAEVCLLCAEKIMARQLKHHQGPLGRIDQYWGSKAKKRKLIKTYKACFSKDAT